MIKTSKFPGAVPLFEGSFGHIIDSIRLFVASIHDFGCSFRRFEDSFRRSGSPIRHFAGPIRHSDFYPSLRLFFPSL
ncbi:hypothetical protein [Lysinibacillus xylanilyticus]|uniref:hypothetical protein n=1 Tax=Lysinibacillus xylanilyticus TaxID=582475 RepID=UPI003806E96D